MYIYLYLHVFTIFFPLVLSFDKRVQFYKKLRFLLPAIAVTAVFFIIWDVLFTQEGVWGFNPEYLTGVYIINLPVEEVLFFITVPYACVFIYETLNTYWPKAEFFKKAAPFISVALIITLPVIAVFNIERLYTSITFLLLAGALLAHHLLFKARYMAKFYRAYLVHLLPFLIVNGVLTYLPIVWYNNDYNTGLRMVSIPVEDTLYSMLLLLLTVSAMEGLRERYLAKQKTYKTVRTLDDVQPARAN